MKLFSIITKFLAFTVYLISVFGYAHSQISVTEKQSSSNVIFPLVEKRSASIYYDGEEQNSVETSSQLFADNIERVSNKKAPVRPITELLEGNIVLVGSMGKI